MPISREYARSLFAELTQDAAVPLEPDELLHMPRLREHGHVFLGDTAVRGYKHRGRWTYDERDIRAAGRAFADMEVRMDDDVDVQHPVYRDIPERDSEEWHRPDWRRRMVSWMCDRARNQLLEHGRPYDEWGSWQTIGASGLPGELTWEEFVASSSGYRHTQNIAGTRPLQLLAWSGKTWLLPRAYVDLLDRWEQARRSAGAVSRTGLH